MFLLRYNIIGDNPSCQRTRRLLCNGPRGSKQNTGTEDVIMKLHEANIKVIMDVVYNHTYLAENSNFNILYPGYYYRLNEDGSFSNGSGCGNELATEKPMVRKFILDSVKFWLEEYKMDGFRFDLMALIDKDTMKEIVAYLKGAKRDVIIYGEPWAAGPTVLPHDR